MDALLTTIFISLGLLLIRFRARILRRWRSSGRKARAMRGAVNVAATAVVALFVVDQCDWIPDEYDFISDTLQLDGFEWSSLLAGITISKGQLLASRRYSLVYANIPKSACTTIKNILYRIDTGAAYPDPTLFYKDTDALDTCALCDGEDPPGRMRHAEVRFTFVREPTRRIFSTFNQKILGDAPGFVGKRELWRTQFGGRYSPDAQLSLEQHQLNFTAFLRMVNATITGELPKRVNGHWAPQTALLEFYANRLPLTYVGRVETFRSDMARVLTGAGVSPLPNLAVRFNEGASPPFTLAETLTDESRALIATIYAEDFAQLGYESPLVPA